MPLQPQNVDVPFEGGLDTNLDRKKVIPGKLLDLENAVFDGRSLNMRPGGSVLPSTTTELGTLPDAKSLAVRDTELLCWTSGGIYGRVLESQEGAWQKRVGIPESAPLTYSVTPLVARAASCESYESVTVSGLTVTTWTEKGQAGRELRATVQDAKTGVRYQDAALLVRDTNGQESWRIHARVLVFGGVPMVAYATSGPAGTVVLGTVSLSVLLPSAPRAFVAPQYMGVVTQRPARTNPFEFDAVATSAGIALSRSADTGIVVDCWSLSTTSGAATFAGSVTEAPVSGGAMSYLSHSLSTNGAGGRVYVTFTNPNTGLLELRTVDPVAVAHVASGSLGSAGAYTTRIAAYEESSGVMRGTVDLVGTPFAAALQTARWAATTGAVTQAFTGNPADAFAWGVSLAGQPAQVGGRWLQPVASPLRGVGAESPGIQPTLFLLDLGTGRVVLRALDEQCGVPNSSTWHLPRVMQSSGSSASFLVPKRVHVEFTLKTGVLTDLTSVGLVRLAVAPVSVPSLERTEEGRCLHVGGAAPAFYDGSTWAEDGFHLRPAYVTATSTIPSPLPSGTYYLGTTPGSVPPALSAGTYSWTACYEWVDVTGRVHRSAPAVPATLTVAQDAQAYLTIPCLGLTAKQGVRIVVYRTLANGTVFYRVGTSVQSFVQPTPPLSDTQGFYDVQTDAAISVNEVLPYTGPTGGTSGGELWHVPPPAYAAALLHQGYLFVLPMDEPNNVAYSLPLATDEGPAWADELRIRVPNTYGLAVGLSSLDGNVIVHCERGMWAIVGQGPSRDGRNNGLQDPVHVTGSVGCVSAASILSTTEGIFYQAPQGYFCLTRGLETAPAGEDVQRYAALAVSQAVEVPSRRELRWYTASGTTLVYSQRWQQWAVWVGQPTQDAAVFGGVPHYADGAQVRYEDPTSGYEAGAPLQMRVGTAWLKWGGFLGFQRLWKALMLGTASGNFTLQCEVFYDNADLPGQTHSSTFTGTSAQAWRVRLTLGKQLCNTVRFRWTLAGVSGRCDITLSALALEFGVHPRYSKRGVQNYGITGGTP